METAKRPSFFKIHHHIFASEITDTKSRELDQACLGGDQEKYLSTYPRLAISLILPD